MSCGVFSHLCMRFSVYLSLSVCPSVCISVFCLSLTVSFLVQLGHTRNDRPSCHDWFLFKRLKIFLASVPIDSQLIIHRSLHLLHLKFFRQNFLPPKPSDICSSVCLFNFLSHSVCLSVSLSYCLALHLLMNLLTVLLKRSNEAFPTNQSNATCIIIQNIRNNLLNEMNKTMTGFFHHSTGRHEEEIKNRKLFRANSIAKMERIQWRRRKNKIK